MRRRVIVLVNVLLVASLLGAEPSAAEPGAETASVFSSSDSDLSVPVASVSTEPSERLSSRSVVGLPDPDVGRDGFAFGFASGEVLRGGDVPLGNLPVDVNVDAELFSGSVMVDVRVADPEIATSVTPYAKLAVQLDLTATSATDEESRSATVMLDYSGARLGYGAGLAERLTVYHVTDCVVVLDEMVCAGDWTPVPTVNNSRDRTLTFSIVDSDLSAGGTDAQPGASMPRVSVSGAPYTLWWDSEPGSWYVVGSSLSGPQGDFSASPIANLADYQVGLYTGAFSVTYPIEVPPAFFGPQPSISLGYDSGTVDGMVGTVGTQASTVGLGWSYHPGSITRIFRPCKSYRSGWTSSDLCPTNGEIFYLTLNGVASRLVEVDTTNRIFRLENEQFWELQLYDTATNNRDNEGEWWELRTPDGSVYQFGREQNASYDSSQDIQVYVPNGENPGGWCGGSTNVYCDKAYQWNLEKVTDVDGYTMEFFWTREMNYYKVGLSWVREYTRAAHVDYIVYGNGPGKDDHAKVDFTYDERCFETTCDDTDPQDYPDTPVDLACGSGSCSITGPSYWTQLRLSDVETYVSDDGGTTWDKVDHYELSHEFPTVPEDPDGDENLTKLWLTGIQRLGVSEVTGDAAVADMPAMEFNNMTLDNHLMLPNRLWYVTSSAVVAPGYMPRISYIKNELGGVTEITYGRSHDCGEQGDSYDTSDVNLDDWPFGNDSGNDIEWNWASPNVRRECDSFPGRDPNDNNAWVYWRKWKVMEVTQKGQYGNPDVTTTYDYRIDDANGDPTTGPIWKYKTNDVDSGDSVWNDFRGHHQVKVINNSDAYTIHTFYRGMEGDNWPGPHANYPTLDDDFQTSDSTTYTDYDYLKGRSAEVHAYDSSNNSLTRTITEYYAAELNSGKDNYYVRPDEVTDTVFGSPNVTSSVEYTFDDDHGNPTQVTYNGTAGDTAVTEETTWIQSSSHDLMYVPRYRKLWSGTSPGTAGNEQAMVEYFYDSATSSATAPTDGRLTKTRYYSQRSPSDDYVDTEIAYHATSKYPVTYTDPNGIDTTFSYDSDFGSMTSQTVDDGGTDELTTDYTVHPGRGLIWTMTDENSSTTKWVYDQLGRLDEVYRPVQYGGSDPSLRFTYSNFTSTSPARTLTETLQESGTPDVYLDAFEYTDGFGRPIQTQTWYDQDGDGTADDRVLTTTGYDTVGRTQYQSAPYVNTYGGAGTSYVKPQAQWLALDGSGDEAASSYTTGLPGDIDLSARLRLADHTPSIGYTVVSQWGAANSQRSVRAGFDSSGRMMIAVAEDSGGGQYLSLDGSGDYAEIDTSFDPGYTEDLDWRIRVRPADWTPGSDQVLMAMDGQPASPQRTATYDTGGTGSSSSGTSHSIPITTATDGTAERPTLVVVLIQTYTANTSYTFPAGWTEMGDYGDGDGSGAAAYKLFTGAVDNITVTSSSSTGPNYEWISYTDVGSVTYTNTDHPGSGHFDPPSHTASESVDSSYDVWLAYDSGRERGGNPGHQTPSGYTRRHERLGSTLMGSFFSRAGTDSATEDPGRTSVTWWPDVGVMGTMALHGVDPVNEWSATLSLTTGGTLELSATNGIDSFTRTSTAAVPSVTDDSTEYWLRVTWDGSTGDANFYYDDDSAQGSYTQIGSAATGTGYSIENADTVMRIGDDYGTGAEFTGRVFEAEFLDAISGTTAADPRFNNATEWDDNGPNSDGELNSWDLNGDAAIDSDITVTTLTSTVAISAETTVVDNTTDLEYRWTLDVDNGASGADAKFYWRADPDDDWDQLGATVTNGSTLSPQTPTEQWLIGGDNGSSFGDFAGRVHGVTITNGIDGTVVAAPNFDDPVEWPSTAAHTDAQSNTWTPAGNAIISVHTGAWLLDSYTRTTYDDLSRVTDVDAMSHGTVLFGTDTTYGTATNQTWVKTTDPESRWITRYSDGFGRLAKVEEPGSPSNAITSYAYTVRGELDTVTDAASNVIDIDYDLLGRKTAMSDPDMGDWSYGYDDAGNLTSQTDGRDVTLTFEYDNLNRITARKKGTTTLAEWSYGSATATSNRAGRLTKTRINGNDTDAVYEIDGYNANGEITSEQWTIAGDDYDIDYTYTADGKIDTITYPLVPGESTREVVTHGWDTLGRPEDLVGDETYVDAATWTPQGLPDTWDLGPSASAIERSWTYDPQTLRVTEYLAGTTQLTGDSSRNIMDLTYDYDDSGNVTSIVDGMNSDQRECYEYDSLNRLTRGFTGNSTCTTYDGTTGAGVYDESYTYTSIHNINTFDGTSYTYGTGNDSGTGDAGPHAVTDVGTTIDLEYDDNGNRTKKTENTTDITSYVYNDENRLESVTMPNSEEIEFVYAADGQRVSRTNGDYTTVYVGGLLEIDEGLSGVTNSRTSYAFAGAAIAVREHEADEITFLAQNHLGSLTAAFNDDTNALALARYGPWGIERSLSGVPPTDRRFTGQVADNTSADSGGSDLLYYNARYLDAGVGTFVSPDSLVPDFTNPQAFHRYGYAMNRPTVLVDPTGHLSSHPNVIHGGGLQDCGPGTALPECGHTYPGSVAYQIIYIGTHTDNIDDFMRLLLNPGDAGRPLYGANGTAGCNAFRESAGSPSPNCMPVNNDTFWAFFTLFTFPYDLIALGRAAFSWLDDLGDDAGRLGATSSISDDVATRIDDVLARVDAGLPPPRGVKGGRVWHNDGRNGSAILPELTTDGASITYREWDLGPAGAAGRGQQRVLTGSDGSAWYTADHYTSIWRYR